MVQEQHYHTLVNREPWYAGVPDEERIALARAPIHVMLDNLRSAFNVGSIFRTADACAVTHLHLCGMTAHPPHKKLEKTALGAFDYVPWSYYERNRDCLDVLEEQGIPVVAVETVEGAPDYRDFCWPSPVAVVFGNEENGVNARVLRRCSAVVQIPMFGYKKSINVATAFGIVVYHILDEWRKKAKPTTDEDGKNIGADTHNKDDTALFFSPGI
ncbi:MAG: RNA methyltransferase [Candidatus Hydrogenedentes bacterium]|jgi:23S rRNA (guanosine2251-2'-O)-methyltransferase|nr:RNA methyltransferase [Candidatus Hydrogenedentota bacterium]